MSIFLVQFFALGLPCPKNDYDPLNYSYDFDTPELPYPYTSLEPIVWAEVVYFHHEKHHEEASKHLNKIIEEKQHYIGSTIWELLQQYGNNDVELKNWGGSYYNHSLLWWILSPPTCINSLSQGSLLDKIIETWGTFENFQNEFEETALKLFGSGWTWLCSNASGELSIQNWPNEDSPLIQKEFVPFMGVDMWEHAYYLDYLNDKQEYLDSIWPLIDWPRVEDFYVEFASKGEAVPVQQKYKMGSQCQKCDCKKLFGSNNEILINNQDSQSIQHAYKAQEVVEEEESDHDSEVDQFDIDHDVLEIEPIQSRRGNKVDSLQQSLTISISEEVEQNELTSQEIIHSVQKVQKKFGQIEHLFHAQKRELITQIKAFNKKENKDKTPYENGIYLGETLNSVRHGYGRMVYNNGDLYQGYWDNGKKEGVGQTQWLNDNQYIGEFKDDKKIGIGEFRWKDGSTYLGEWKNNKMHGIGRYKWLNLREYIGEWVKGKMQGFGIFKWPDGRKYEGQFSQSQRHGKGIFYMPNDEISVDEWKANKIVKNIKSRTNL